MFIKIKLEPQNLKATLLLKKISYFSIDDDATIFNLKMKIEEYVDVPAERQEIRTLVEVFQNTYYVKEVCDVRGSSIMLYAYDECHETAEPQFVCFLQVYTNELAAQQQELEQRSKLSIDNTKKLTPTSSTSSITLIAGSDTDRYSTETDTDASSSKSDLDSASSTSNSNSSGRKKRSKLEKKCGLQNKKSKVTATASEYSDTLRQYLDEFPNSPKQTNSTNDNVEACKTQPLNKSPNNEIISNNFTTISKSSEINKSDENGDKHLESINLQKSLETTVANLNSTITPSNTVITTINNDIHPCYSISPEIRDYLVIISPSDMNVISDIECEELLVWFFDRFRACDSSNNLQFDDKKAISLYEGKLWVACMNFNTFEWISTNVIKYSLNSYKILALKDSKHLCEVVVPLVSNSKNVLDIFGLLEKQNKNIITLKWSLQSRKALLAEDKDFHEKAISTFCKNELFNITMDTESKNYLGTLNFKLKYCFWQIVFKFI